MSAESDTIKQTVRRLVYAARRVSDDIHAAQRRRAYDETRRLTTVKVGLLRLAHWLMPEWVSVGATDDFMCDTCLAVRFNQDGLSFHVPHAAWFSTKLD